MKRWCGKVAVVTGASSGIGAAVAEELVKAGLQVVGLARRVNKVEELSKKLEGNAGKLYAIKCDVTKHEEIVSAFEWTKQNLGHVHILVNNAGLFKIGSLIEGNPEHWQATMDTNVIAVAMCAQEAIKQMREKDIAGHIVNINSITGHHPTCGIPPILNMYSPSKHAVTVLSDMLVRELRHFNTKIKITSISPGMVDTGIFEVSGLHMDVNQLPHLKAKEIADCILYILGTPPHVHIHEFTVTPLGQNY